MSATILGGDVTVYFEADNRQKRLEWTGSATGTRTVNEVYSALQELFDDLIQLDDGTPMSAQTPTEYTIGIIDTGDDDPWFIDNTTAEHLTGGAIQTASWSRVATTNTGIVRIEYTTGTDFITSDIGNTVSSTEGDSGTLLDFNSTGATNYAWIRPDSSAAANNWDSATGTITVTAGSGASVTQSAAAVTGEDLWSNINTIGTIADNTHIYVQQNGTLLTAAKDTTDWWGDGQIDILIKVREMGTEIDEAVVNVFARQLTKTYSFFSSDLTNGGRTAIPLGTGTDLNNQEGVRQMVVTTASADFTVGEVIQDDSDSTIQGVVTSNTGTAPNLTIQYYLIGDPLNDFTGATGGFTGQTSSSTATAVAPTSVNSGSIAGLSITYGANTTFDVDENDTNETYSIVIDVSDETLTDAYQWSQYITRRGGTTTTNTDGIEGQFYLGVDFVLQYSGTVSGGTIDEGNTVTQATTGATGTVIGHDTTNKIITLRNSRGTFNTSNTVTDDTSSGSITPDTAATPIAVNVASPFGTFAGGVWFLARSVVLNNVLAADAQNFVTTTDDGTTVNPPNKQSLTIANTRDEDRIAVFRLTGAGGVINKEEYAATVQAAGAGTVVVGSSIATDVPGKTAGGVLRIVDIDGGSDSDGVEYRLRYSSWTGTTFTLANTTGTATASTDTDTLHDSGASFTTTAQIGDLLYNSTRTAYAYVTSVVSNTQLELDRAITGQVSGDSYELNAIPLATTVNDFVYVPLLDVYEDTGTDGSTGSASSTITYSSDIPVLIIARNSNATASATTPMLPYSAEATFGSTGLTNNVIRTLDSIKT